ncbi:MAG TPA: iron-sulfur cluster assembly accessory protein [Burkholderiales bacterium]
MNVSLAPGEILLHALLREGRDVAHDCDGALACASCVVIVREGAERLSPPSEDELDILERASFSEPNARLACQALGEGELVVTVPRLDLPRLAAGPGLRPVMLSERAARHFAVQLAKRPAAAGVRLSVVPSGCSGFGYRVDFAEEARAGDAVFESGAIRIFVDPPSLPYVQGAAIDVVREGLARRLRFDNPNARHTCGCGESFGT